MKLKRLLSLFVSATMLVSAQGMVVHADSAYTDYTPGAKPANMIPDASDRYGVTYTICRHANMEYTYWKTDADLDGGYRVKYAYTGSEPLSIASVNEAWRGMSGFWLNAENTGSGGKAFGFDPQGGETYVVSLNVKNASTEGVTPYFNISANNSYGPANLIYPNEYGATGMALTDQYQKFNASITYPEGYDNTKAFGNRIATGIVDGSAVGSAFYIDVSSADAMYVAKEVAYDINVSVSQSEVARGETLTATASLLNQVGTKGGLSQNFDWVVLDANRNVVSDGFEIVGSGANVGVTPSESVSGGKYYVYASSKTNSQMGKACAFTISDYSDYVPGDKPTNLIPKVTSNYQYFGARLSECDHANWWNTSEGLLTFDIKYPSDSSQTADLTPVDGWRAFSGFWINQGPGGYDGSLPDFAPADGETYVLSMRLKDVSADGVPSPYVGYQMNNTWGPSTIVTSNEYGKTGMKVERDWTVFNTSITLPDDYMTNAKSGDYAKKLVFGFVTGTKVGSQIRIDASTDDSIYLAKEVAYDIVPSVVEDGVGSSDIKTGDSVTVDCQVVNQLLIPGGLDQSVSWMLLDSERKPVVGGATFEETSDGTVMHLGDVPTGTYYVYASSDEYVGMGKGVAIEITNLDTTQLVDYVPGDKYENLIPDASDHYGYTYTGVAHGKMDATYFETDTALDGGFRVKFAYNGTTPVSLADMGEAWKGFQGFWMNRTNGSGCKDFGLAPQAGETYVFSANVKNASADGVTPSFGVAINDSYNPARSVTSNEYGAEGKPLTNEFEAFNATLTFPDDYNCTQAFGTSLAVGLANGSPVGSAFYIDASKKDSIYIAKEQVYNIVAEADKRIVLSEEGYMDVTAKVVNQLSEVGTLPQHFEWFVLNEDKEIVSNIEVLPVADNEVYLQWYNGSADDGDYILAVRSTDYPNMVRLLNFSIVDNFSDIYVAPNGSDSANGSAEAPLASFAGAVDMVREYRKSNNTDAINVNFATGTYYVNGEELDETFSQAEYGKVVFKAEDGADVHFIGSKALDLASAPIVTDATVRARLKESVRDKVVAIDVSALDLTLVNLWPTMGVFTAQGEWPTLYADGNEQGVAQWPNGDANYAKFDYVYEGGSLVKNKLAYGDEKPSTWASTKDAWVGGYLNYDYKYLRIPVSSASADDITLRLYQYNYDSDMCVGKVKTIAQRYKVFNVLEELDTPGEWFIDRDSQMLYYYPPTGINNLEISGFDKTMINIENADNIGFEGITFEKTRGNAILTTDSNKITVKNCTFKNIGADAFAMAGTQTAQTDKDYWQVQNIDAGYDCRVEDSVFFNIGGQAVELNGGNVDTLTNGNNVCKNNIITKVAQTVKNYEAIVVRGCGNKVINNNISRAPFQAIRFYGNNHDILYNEIYNVIQESDDCGAIYCGRNTVQRGTQIKYNYIHDLYATDDLPFGHRVGIYLDDKQTGITARYNIIKDVEKNFYTNGVDNNYSNNTSINIQTTNMYVKNGGAACNTNVEQDTFGGYIADESLYYSTYPNLKKIVESSSLNASSLGKLNILKNNLSVNGPSGDGIDTNTKGWIITNSNVSNNQSTDDTSIFVDPTNQDYRVKSTSAYAQTVLSESFDIDLIGTDLDLVMDGATLVAPHNDGTALTHLQWYDTLGATSYSVLVSKDADFTELVASEDTFYPYLDVELEDGTYYYQVIASNTSRELNQSVESVVGSFIKGATSTTVDVVASVVDGKLSGTITNNKFADGINAEVYVAQYDATGRLVSASVTATSLTYGSAVALPQVSISANSAKLFVWSLNQPIVNATILK